MCRRKWGAETYADAEVESEAYADAAGSWTDRTCETKDRLSESSALPRARQDQLIRAEEKKRKGKETKARTRKYSVYLCYRKLQDNCAPSIPCTPPLVRRRTD